MEFTKGRPRKSSGTDDVTRSHQSDDISTMLKNQFRPKIRTRITERCNPVSINKGLHNIGRRLMFRCRSNSLDDMRNSPKDTCADESRECSNSNCNYCSIAVDRNRFIRVRKYSSLTSIDTDDFQGYNSDTLTPGTAQSTVPCFMEDDCLHEDPPDSESILVRFNISGVPFLILFSTLKRDPYFFAKIVEDAMWIPSTREYFFERDPVVFRFIHNYLRLGELHLPLSMCGPLLEKELDAWEIPLGLDIQRCCLGPVIESKSKLESLQKFEKKLDSKRVPSIPWIKSDKWQNFREIVWHILEDPFKPTVRNHPPIDDIEDGVRTRGDSTSIIPPNLQQPGNESTYTKAAAQPNISRCRTSEGFLQRRVHLSQNEIITNVNELLDPVGSDTSKHRLIDRWLPLIRISYLTYEILIIASAVVVLISSTVPNQRSTLHQVESQTSTVQENGFPTLRNSHENSTRSRFPSQPLVIAEFFFSTVIAIDVVLRMVFCPSLKHWLLSPYTIIDILSLIPFVFDLIVYAIVHSSTISVSRHNQEALLRLNDIVIILKVFVVLRLFRILRRHRNTRVLLYSIRTTLADVAIILVLILVSSLFFGSAIYFADKTFQDIPRGTWWALVTMSTVGYGDLVPKQNFGFLVSIVCILMGTLLMSYNIPILVNHFLLYYDHADQLYQLKQLHRSAKIKVRLRRRLMKLLNRRCGRSELRKFEKAPAKESTAITFTSIRKLSVNSHTET